MHTPFLNMKSVAICAGVALLAWIVSAGGVGGVTSNCYGSKTLAASVCRESLQLQWWTVFFQVRSSHDTHPLPAKPNGVNFCEPRAGENTLPFYVVYSKP